MFDGLCILIALALFRLSHEGHRNIAFLVLCFFVVSEVIYKHFFLEFRSDNPWVIYQLYNLINLVILYRLYKAQAHTLIAGLIVANVLVNITVSFYFISDVIPVEVYESYPYVAGVIAVLVLAYMGVITDHGTRYFHHDNSDNRPFSGVLFFCNGILNRRLG